MHADPPDEGAWVVAVDEQELEGVQEHQHELDLIKNNKMEITIETQSNSLLFPQ